MKRILEVCLVALAFVIKLGPAVGAQPAPTPQSSSFAASSFAGTWKGTMNDLPGIDLTILETDTKITGSVVFYFQERTDVKSPWQVKGEYRAPLLAANINGKTLTFEVEHHVCHGCPELGPNVTFRMELAGPNEARLWKIEEDGTESPQTNLLRANEASAQAAPPMQAGISVEMPVASNAPPMPDADQEDAVIVTVTADSRVYLGVNPVDGNALAAELQRSLANRAEKKLYIKADARTSYTNVVHVLDAARAAGVVAPILLTAQQESSAPGTMVSPNGLRVVIGQLASRAEQLR